MQNNIDINQFNDLSWQSALKAGKEQFGNLEVNLRFLEQTHCFKTNDRILELGCGIGTIVHWLSQKGCHAVGSDISETAVEYGRRKYPGIALSVESAEELNWKDGEFDCVLSFDVFEHLFGIDKHLREVARVLKPNGCYLFQTPNKYSNALFETLHSRSLQWKNYHPSLHTPRQLKKRLLKHNFTVRFIKMNPVTPFFLKKLQRLPLLVWLVKKIPFQHLPLCLQTNLYVIAQKADTALPVEIAERS